MKKLISILASVLALTLAATAFAGCGAGKNKTPTGALGLEIAVYDAGYGTAWVENLGKAFNAKREAEGKELANIKIVPKYQDTTEGELTAGPAITTTDLFIVEFPASKRLALQTLNDDGVTPLLADLTEVANAKLDGHDETVAERMYTTVYDDYHTDHNGKEGFFSLPAINDALGLYYNADLFERNGLDVPLTTEQLFEVADAIEAINGVYPFIWYAGYWQYAINLWWAQYEGLEAFNRFFSPEKDVNPNNANSEYMKQIDGRQSALEILNRIVNPELHANYNYPGTTSLDFTTAQTNFLLERAAMIPVGGWMEREMEDEAVGKNVRLMRMPVNSALGEKLGLSETQLRAAVKGVDDGKTDAEIAETAGIAAENAAAVRAARGLSCVSTAYTEVALAPSYSDALPLVREFLTFMFTEEGMKVKFDTAGIMPAIRTDYSKLITAGQEISSFKQSKVDVMSAESYEVVDLVPMKSPFYFVNALQPFNQDTTAVARKFGSQAAGDRVSVAKYLSDEQSYMERQWSYYWNELTKYGY